MTKTRKTLFEPIVPLDKRHPLFEILRTSPGREPARWMLDEIYQSFENSDGNFLEQFQTSAFNARFFELYLFAYFSRSGFIVDQSFPSPDFLVSRGDTRVAVEATTLNPSTSGLLLKMGKKISDLEGEELREYEQHELPIRFAGALSSKLQKRYWELEHCKGLPLVLAIEAFHDDAAFMLADGALIQYLYGNDEMGVWDPGGQFRIDSRTIKEHTIGEKTIQSGFFWQPDTQHISAVLFTNSGSSGKFSRMGYQHGIGCDTISMTRVGYCLNPDYANAKDDPTYFSYNLDEPPFVEPWGQGLVTLHNPNALKPLPEDFFAGAIQSHFKDGRLRSDPSHWHPLSSQTVTFPLPTERAKEALQAMRPIQFAVAAISQNQFRESCGFIVPSSVPVEESGWLVDATSSFFGLVLQDKHDHDWGYMVLGRDAQFCFRSIDMKRSLATRYQARMELQQRMAGFLVNPRRIFSE